MDGELCDIQYWNPIANDYQDTPPTFPVGHWGGLACRGVNHTDEDQSIYMTFGVMDPNGYLIDSWTTDAYVVHPGEGLSANYGVYCDIPGDYKMEVILRMFGFDIVDTISWTIVCWATAAPEVYATIDTWWLWDAVETDWVRPSPTLIPPGSDIGIRVRGKNNCDVEIDIRADVRYHSPSGRTKAFTGSIVTVPPGQSVSEYPLWDFLWEADEAGDWDCNIIIYAGLPGESLEEVDRREDVGVAHVATYVPPEPPESDIKEFDFSATPGTYDFGDSVPYTAPYEYKGKAQGGYLTISLGTGVYPSFFTKHTFPHLAVSFEQAMDWASGYLSGSFTLPITLEPGQTYSVRAKLETADGKQETDTDWDVLTIREGVVPPPEEEFEHLSVTYKPI